MDAPGIRDNTIGIRLVREAVLIPYGINKAYIGESRKLHTRDYRTADEFAGKHVVVVGAGISAIQLLDELLKVASDSSVIHDATKLRADLKKRL